MPAPFYRIAAAIVDPRSHSYAFQPQGRTRPRVTARRHRERPLPSTV
jgi:hypothetical protein